MHRSRSEGYLVMRRLIEPGSVRKRGDRALQRRELARPDTGPRYRTDAGRAQRLVRHLVLTVKREWIIKNQRLLLTLFDADMLLSREDDHP
jgi:hypothetical protein